MARKAALGDGADVSSRGLKNQLVNFAASSLQWKECPCLLQTEAHQQFGDEECSEACREAGEGPSPYEGGKFCGLKRGTLRSLKREVFKQGFEPNAAKIRGDSFG